MTRRLAVVARMAALLLAAGSAVAEAPPRPASDVVPTVEVTRRIRSSLARDPRFICLWAHPEDPRQGLVIAADMTADRLLVHTLEGDQIQTLPIEKPADIDIAGGFTHGGTTGDVIVVLSRGANDAIAVYTVDAKALRLRRIDDGGIRCGLQTSIALYRSPTSGQFSVILGSRQRRHRELEQFILIETESGAIRGKRVRTQRVNGIAGITVDHRTGSCYVNQAASGIWHFDAEPRGEIALTRIIPSGIDELPLGSTALALMQPPDGATYLVAMNTSHALFTVFRCAGRELEHVGKFRVSGVLRPYGVTARGADFGPQGPDGLLACHGTLLKREHGPLFIVPWSGIARALDLEAQAAAD